VLGKLSLVVVSVLQAEIKLVARLHSDEIATVLRLVVNNESGYDLRFYVYAERSDDGAGRTKFYSLNRRNVGPWEGLCFPLLPPASFHLTPFAAFREGRVFSVRH
jgi:hypothetical protein